jgi:hypothetical protein
MTKANPFFSWLGGIFAPLTTYIEYRGKIKKAEHDRELAVITGQTKLVQSGVDNNHNWEMQSLKDKDKTLRLFSYSMFTAPILITVISPGHGAEIFKNLEGVPPWLIQTWIAINGGVWGIASLKNVVPQFITLVKRAKNG